MCAYSNIIRASHEDISALLIQGGAIWLGTRNGHILLLDSSTIEKQNQNDCLRGLQHCGDGRVKSIVPVGTGNELKVSGHVQFASN